MLYDLEANSYLIVRKQLFAGTSPLATLLEKNHHFSKTEDPTLHTSFLFLRDIRMDTQ